jgi:MarR family transcriptional regulator for hemolysin
MNDLHQRFSSLLHQTAALWRTTLDRRLKPLGFSQASWRTLIALRREPDGCNQTALADRLGIESPTLVRLLDRMEEQGWVRRVPDPKDRRSKRVELTSASLELAARMEQEVATLRAELLAGLGVEQLEAATALLEGVRQRAETLLAESRAGAKPAAKE